jgi:hypothetical protein
MELHINNIENVSVSAKPVVKVDKDGEITESYILTTVKLEVRDVPGKFDDLLRTVESGHKISADFRAAQLEFSMQ